MRGEGDHHAGWVLQLLADDWAVALMRELEAGPLRPLELQERLPGLSRSGSMRRLRELSLHGVVAREQRSGSPPHVQYALTDRARELLEIAELAERWERGPSRVSDPPAGTVALSLVADGRCRAIVRALADGPLSYGELGRRLPGLSHAALARRLRQLALGGVLIAPREPRREVRYELTPSGRRLALVVVLSVRWQWHWARPADPGPSSDLGGLVHLIAPLARTPPRIAGICALHVDAPVPHALGVHVAVGSGRISALALAPLDPADAQGRARPPAWCDALAHGDPTPIAIDGDRALLTAVVGALSVALRV
jgi:DNA-binding HxlR family transcriptional regulator